MTHLPLQFSYILPRPYFGPMHQKRLDSCHGDSVGCSAADPHAGIPTAEAVAQLHVMQDQPDVTKPEPRSGNNVQNAVDQRFAQFIGLRLRQPILLKNPSGPSPDQLPFGTLLLAQCLDHRRTQIQEKPQFPAGACRQYISEGADTPSGQFIGGERLHPFVLRQKRIIAADGDSVGREPHRITDTIEILRKSRRCGAQNHAGPGIQNGFTLRRKEQGEENRQDPECGTHGGGYYNSCAIPSGIGISR